MSYTKHKYEEIFKKNQTDFAKYIDTIIPILPAEYTAQTIINYLKQYYPFEYSLLEEQYKYYNGADIKLVEVHKKRRYNPVEPNTFLERIIRKKKLLTLTVLKHHKETFSKLIQEQRENELKKVRLPRINKKRNKIAQARQYVQMVGPVFLDKLMGFYDRKNASQKDKVYILTELKKYYSPKTVRFFKKLANSEYDFQLREMAFYYLQSFGHFVELRKQKYMQIHTKNKRRRKRIKESGKIRYIIPETPEELAYRINNQAKEQKYKAYDYFISHSYKDFKSVQYLIDFLNYKKKNIYCDWISDKDYLKRNLFCEDTVHILEQRIRQSYAVIFVSSVNSKSSYWVQRELKYAQKCGKEILEVDKEAITSKKIVLKKYKKDEGIIE